MVELFLYTTSGNYIEIEDYLTLTKTCHQMKLGYGSHPRIDKRRGSQNVPAAPYSHEHSLLVF